MYRLHILTGYKTECLYGPQIIHTEAFLILVFIHFHYVAWHHFACSISSFSLNDELRKCGTGRSLCKRNYFDISLKNMRTATVKTWSYDMRCAGPNSNRAPPDYNVETLPPQPINLAPFSLGLRGIPLSQTRLAFMWCRQLWQNLVCSREKIDPVHRMMNG